MNFQFRADEAERLDSARPTATPELGDYEASRTSSGASEDALSNYQHALDIAPRLAHESPGDSRAQRDLSFACQKMGAQLMAKDDPADALPILNTSVSILQKLIATERSNPSVRADLVSEYAVVAGCQFLLHDFKAALSSTQAGLKLSPGRLSLQLTQAHALLFLDQKEDARTIYLQHRGEKIPGGRIWEDAVCRDFDHFEKNGLTCAGVAEIRDLLSVSK